MTATEPRGEATSAPAAVSTPASEAIGGEAGSRSYHGQPVLKEPIWSWEIPTYFFTGGTAGASAGLAFCAGLRGNEVLARRAWTVSLAGVVASPGLLISDLGRPGRFLNMLRMVKVTSPMSMGTWILSGAGGSITFAAVNAWTGWFPRAARLARPAAALLGLPLSTYTAALITNTAVPVWHEARQTLPFVFGSGAALSAGATAVAITPIVSAAPARRLALAAAVAELGAIETMRHRLGEHADPYKHGAAARFRHIRQTCSAAGAILLAARGRSSRSAGVASGALLAAGALSARWAIFKAGFQSAADPKYVVGPQRGAIERGERPGAARKRPR
jgi:hypothetical protein